MRHADGVNDVATLEDLRQSDDLNLIASRLLCCIGTSERIWVEIKAKYIAIREGHNEI